MMEGQPKYEESFQSGNITTTTTNTRYLLHTHPFPNSSYPQSGFKQQDYQPQVGGYHCSNTVIIQQPSVIDYPLFRHVPVHTKCPSCQAEVLTKIHYEVGTLVWILCFVTVIVGCFFGCCLVPFCVEGCKDVIHTCPNCQHTFARWRRL